MPAGSDLCRRSVLGVVFLVSGIPALVAQLAWSRILSAGLGHEVPALAGVLSAFFVGLAVGARWLGQRAMRSPRPAVWYAGAELFSAAWIVAGLPLLGTLAAAAGTWGGPDAGGFSRWIAGSVLSLVIVGPAAAAMGATFPAMERAVGVDRSGRSAVAALYALNTAGAVLGVLLAVGWLMPSFGFRATLGVAAALQGICALAVLAIERGSAAVGRGGPSVVTASSPDRPAWSSRRLGWIAAISGLASLGYQWMGIRQVAQVSENTLQTYAAVLAGYLVGTALGAAAWRAATRGGRQPGWDTLVVTLATVLLLELTLWSTGFTWSHGWRDVLGERGAELALVAVVFGPPTFLMGALFSALAERASAAGRLASVLGWNLAGCALAPLVWTALLLPWVGVKGCVLGVAALYVLLLAPPWRRRAWITAGALAMVALLPATRTLPRAPADPGATVVRFEEGRLANVAVIRTPDGHRTLRVNQRLQQGGTGTALAARRQGHLPLLLHPQPARALFLGVGTGLSLGAAAAHDGLDALGIELLPGVVRALVEFAPENAGAGGARLPVRVGDARRWVRTDPGTYDVVVGDLFHPAEDGAGFLYTREHFAAVRARLAPRGVYCQWLPVHQLDEATLRDIVRTFLDVFPEATAWLLRFNVDVPVVGLVGTPAGQGLTLDPEALDRRTEAGSLRDAVAGVSLNSAVRILGGQLAGSASLRAWAGPGRVATDDLPSVLFRAPAAVYGPSEAAPRRLERLLDAWQPEWVAVLPPGTDPAWRGRLEAFRSARDLHLRGLVRDSEGAQAEALKLYLRSAAVTPDYTGGYSQAVLVASAYLQQDPAFARRLLEELERVHPEQRLAGDLLRRSAPQ